MKRQTSQVIRALNDHSANLVRDPQGLVPSRAAIAQALTQAGCAITFAPTSAPDLIDYLTVTTVSGLEGALAGAGLGALVGLLFKQPSRGAAIGAGLGGLAGAGRGLKRVENGWRVRTLPRINEPTLVTTDRGETA